MENVQKIKQNQNKLKLKKMIKVAVINWENAQRRRMKDKK